MNLLVIFTQKLSKLMETLKYFVGIFLLLSFTFTNAHPEYLGSIEIAEENATFMASFANMPGYTDYESKLAKISSCIPLEYNPTVRSYIELYTTRTPSLSEKILSLSDIYFPIFEKSLKEEGLPAEFKYLPVTESALDANAVSRAGATGLWQFMSATAKGMHLTVNDYVDERRDPYKSTDAAVRYLKGMYDKYDDWLLVIAAYNCGPGKVDEAIRRSGGIRNFWLLYDYLPRETRNYVPAFIACVYWMHYYLDHSLRLVPHQYSNLFAGSDTVMVRGPLHLNTVGSMLNIDADKLAFMNPALKKRILPEDRSLFCLRLPVTEIWTFKQKREQIYAASRGSINIAAINEKVSTDVWYKVKKGDNLSTIAGKYKCSVTQLKKWNKLKSSSLSPGQKLKVGVKTVQKKLTIATPAPAKDNSESMAAANTNSSSTDAGLTATQSNQKTIQEDKFYRVKKGDALLSIARNESCSVDDLKKWNGLKSNHITIGQKLKTGVTETVVVVEENASTAADGQVLADDNDNFDIDDNVLITDDGEIIFKDQVKPTVAEIYQSQNASIESDNFTIADNITITANGDIIFNNTKNITVLEDDTESDELGDTTTSEEVAVSDFEADDNIIITPNGDILFKDQLPSGYSQTTTQTNYLGSSSISGNSVASFDDNVIITPEGEILFKDQLPSGYSQTTTQISYMGDTAPAKESGTTVTINADGEIIFSNEPLVGNTEVTALDAANDRFTSPRNNSKGANQEKAPTYVVKKGDTLWSIAQKNEGVTIEQILKVNSSLTYKSVLREGVVLTIPAGKK